MMKTGASEIGRSHSHQSVMIKHLSEAHHLVGLKVFISYTYVNAHIYICNYICLCMWVCMYKYM
jgi:hypothetical protein